MRDLLTGYLPITVRLARSLTAEIGGSTEFWMTREAQFQDDLLRVAADRWAESMPTAEMASWGWISRPTSWQVKIEECLGFFGVPTFKDFESRMGHEVGVARFRTSPSFGIEAGAAAAWFRACEIAALQIDGLRASYSPELFTGALAEVLSLTRVIEPESFVPALVRGCAAAGVAVAVVRAPSGCPASGTARMFDGRPLIQLSGRHLSDDHFWFTFFHEAGHVLMHDLTTPVVDVLDAQTDETSEGEANEFASDWLMSRSRAIDGKVDPRALVRLAHENGTSPGVVVGQLQHAGKIPQNRFNGLKRRYSWNGANLENRRKP